MRKVLMYLVLFIVIIIIIIIIIITATSSSIINSVKNAVGGAIESHKDTSLLEELQDNSWSDETFSDMLAWQDAEAESEVWKSTTKETYQPGFSGFMAGVFTGKGFTQKQQIKWYQNEAQSKADMAQSKLQRSMNKDKVLREDTAEKNKKDEGEVPWLLIIIIAIVAIILIILLRRKSNEPVVKEVEAPVGEVDLSNQRMKFNREKSARRICKELNLNYDEELAAADGDLVKLMDRLYDKLGY